MPQSATIKSLPAAFGMMKAMQADGVEWGEDYRQGARQAVAELLRGQMDRSIDEHLKRMASGGAGLRPACSLRGRAESRRGSCGRRHRPAKVASVLLPVLGRPVSPATVRQVAKQLDAAVAAFRRRPLHDIYRVLVLDGVVLKRMKPAPARSRGGAGGAGPAPRRQERRSSTFAFATAESTAQWCWAGLLKKSALDGARFDSRLRVGLWRGGGGSNQAAGSSRGAPEIVIRDQSARRNARRAAASRLRLTAAAVRNAWMRMFWSRGAPRASRSWPRRGSLRSASGELVETPRRTALPPTSGTRDRRVVTADHDRPVETAPRQAGRGRQTVHGSWLENKKKRRA
jgi:hypothetical protein